MRQNNETRASRVKDEKEINFFVLNSYLPK